jgi:hypothetical protein
MAEDHYNPWDLPGVPPRNIALFYIVSQVKQGVLRKNLENSLPDWLKERNIPLAEEDVKGILNWAYDYRKFGQQPDTNLKPVTIPDITGKMVDWDALINGSESDNRHSVMEQYFGYLYAHGNTEEEAFQRACNVNKNNRPPIPEEQIKQMIRHFWIIWERKYPTKHKKG